MKEENIGNLIKEKNNISNCLKCHFIQFAQVVYLIKISLRHIITKKKKLSKLSTKKEFQKIKFTEVYFTTHLTRDIKVVLRDDFATEVLFGRKENWNKVNCF